MSETRAGPRVKHDVTHTNMHTHMHVHHTRTRVRTRVLKEPARGNDFSTEGPAMVGLTRVYLGGVVEYV